ncbi:MAG: helix-turn-helix transcriptional regulator [Anaerolineae bacterium]
MLVAESINSFGAMLKYLRRSARLTQRDLGQATGYTEAHICRLGKNMRPPDVATLAALFVPALELESRPELTGRLLQLASEARRAPPPLRGRWRSRPKRGDTTTLRRRLLCARGDLLRLTLRIGEAESSYREALTLAPSPHLTPWPPLLSKYGEERGRRE